MIAENLADLHRQLTAALEATGRSYELILDDDGSTDGTPDVLRGLAARDPRVRVLFLSRNFGHQLAITAGTDAAAGDAVVVIDGDGSLLMNPGTLATAAHFAPPNLTILAIDNHAYGSTGNQPTLAGSCVDLEHVAKGFGIRNTCKAATKKQLIDAMKSRQKEIRFIHALAKPGNKDVPNIPLGHLEVKKQLADFLKS